MRRIAVTWVTLVLLLAAGTTAFANNGKGRGNGKPVAAVAETLIDTTPDTTPEETWPPTTTIPFDPGTEITGHLDIAASDLRWGGSVAFDAGYEGTPSNRGTIYISVVCQQGAPVVYQWSSADLTFGFPLIQQDGLAAVGAIIDTTQPGACTATLIYRILNDKDHSYQWLDQVTFTVNP
jgi:hypothetical protein